MNHAGLLTSSFVYLAVWEEELVEEGGGLLREWVRESLLTSALEMVRGSTNVDVRLYNFSEHENN